MGVFSRLLPTLVSAFGLQTILAVVFVPQKNEMYYDLGGTLGYLSTALVSLYYPSFKERFINKSITTLPRFTEFAPRQLLLTGCLVIWTTRLGSFLLTRALTAGGDSRFDEIKKSPVQFTTAWLMQAAWIFIVGLPVYLVNSLPAHLHPPLSVRDYMSFGLFASAFLFEVIADHQKSQWKLEKAAKKHDEPFISRGLWSISRHPNYVGEVGIWTGIWALSLPSLQTPYFPQMTPAIAAMSPLFTYWLLSRVSGVPPLEAAGDKKFGDNPKWHEYKRTVPVFWPWGPKN